MGELPWDYYSTFHIEKRHGFNKSTLGLFFTDKIKGLLLSTIIGFPVLSVIITLIKQGGPYFYLYIWAFMFAFSIIMMTLVPILIMPLFNKYTPLEDGVLKTKTVELAKRLKYPLKSMFVMDGSRRSSHSNAFLYGFGGNKRIVLFDTLIKQVKVDEIVGILGHELGHWKLGHSVKNFIITQLYFGIMLYGYSLSNDRGLYSAFGFDDVERNVPTILSLVLYFQTLWCPVDKVVSFLTTLHTRKCEFEADEFSVGLGMGRELERGLVKISVENLGSMVTDKWYGVWHYSHPPLVDRLGAIRDGLKKAQ